MAKTLEGLLCRYTQGQLEGLEEAHERNRANRNVPNGLFHGRCLVGRQCDPELDHQRAEEPPVLGKRSIRIDSTVDGAVQGQLARDDHAQRLDCKRLKKIRGQEAEIPSNGGPTIARISDSEF